MYTYDMITTHNDVVIVLITSGRLHGIPTTIDKYSHRPVQVYDSICR